MNKCINKLLFCKFTVDCWLTFLISESHALIELINEKIWYLITFSYFHDFSWKVDKFTS